MQHTVQYSMHGHGLCWRHPARANEANEANEANCPKWIRPLVLRNQWLVRVLAVAVAVVAFIIHLYPSHALNQYTVTLPSTIPVPSAALVVVLSFFCFCFISGRGV